MAQNAVSVKPILFSGPMVRAILDGRKTQTRRAVKPQPTHIEWFNHQRGWIGSFGDDAGSATNPHRMVPSPYEVGTKLWVRETWWWRGWWQNWAGSEPIHDDPIWHGWQPSETYAADECRRFNDPKDPTAWRKMVSIHMPRWASRLTLEITEVRVQRLKDITTRDCLAEGIQKHEGVRDGYERDEFSLLWDSINHKSHPWSSNPFVWAITFKRID